MIVQQAENSRSLNVRHSKGRAASAVFLPPAALSPLNIANMRSPCYDGHSDTLCVCVCVCACVCVCVCVRACNNNMYMNIYKYNNINDIYIHIYTYIHIRWKPSEAALRLTAIPTPSSTACSLSQVLMYADVF